MTAKTLETAMSKAITLPETVQEQIGHELPLRIGSIKTLRSKLQAGVAQLDAGLGEELDVEDVIRHARREHAAR